MVQSAAMLMRERGIHGVGLREVVAHSGGPRGSLGRYFPGGKTQLMSEAIDVALADLNDELERTLTEAETFPEAIGLILAPWRRLLVDHDFSLGCPLAATVVDAADNDELRAHVNDLLARWHAAVADVYIKFGAAPAVADEHSTVMLAALEGALILARPTQHRPARHRRTLLRGWSSGPGPGGVIPRRAKSLLRLGAGNARLANASERGRGPLRA
jgi:AcrR family transcriptional regulator